MPADSAYDVVHEKTKGTDTYAACQQKTRRASYWAPERRYFPDGSFDVVSVRVPDTMSRKCRNLYLWDSDPKCAGCDQPRDVEYAERMKGMT